MHFVLLLVNVSPCWAKNTTPEQPKPSAEKTLKDKKLLYMKLGFISRCTKGFKVTEGGSSVHECVLLIRQLCCNNLHIASIHWLTWVRQTKYHLGKLGSKWKGNQHSGMVWFLLFWQLAVSHAAVFSAAVSSTQTQITTMKVSSKLAAFPLGVPSLLSSWSAFHFPLRSKGTFGEWYESSRQLLTLASCCGSEGWKMAGVKPGWEFIWLELNQSHRPNIDLAKSLTCLKYAVGHSSV